MHPIDRTILAFCQDDFCPLKPLRQTVPGGSLYRHVKRLVTLGWLRKERGLYRTTEAGLRQLAAAQSGRQWDGLIQRYPPLALVPTPVHRAMSELILAAAVARQQAIRPDRHPFFLAFGGTLHWKTSQGIFLCHALGLNPAIHVVDCGTESGKSLAVRRGGTGTPVFKRELLDAPFLVLDEVLTATPAVRATLSLFLSGRLVVPFENAQLEVCPVPLLTLNPREKDTLEARIGLSAPQIRRGLLANLDAVAMPDLATLGERALVAARDHGPLTVGPPAVDAQAFHRPIVDLIRALLQPEAHARVDVEVVVTLCTGLTAFLPTPVEAIAQVGYDLGLLAETLSWSRPGWIEAVTAFSLDGAPSRPLASQAALPHASAAAPPTGVSAGPPAVVASPTVSLQIPRRPRRTVECPDLSLSDDLRAQLVWFAVETGQPLEDALRGLLAFFLKWRTDGEDTLATFAKILELARNLAVTKIDVDTLHDYLEARVALAEHDCTVEDVPEALRLMELLTQLSGSAWNWTQAETEIEALSALLAAGIAPAEVDAFLARQHRLTALGLDADTAEALAAALAKTGATRERQAAVLDALIDLADHAVERDELEEACQQLRDERARLEAEATRLPRTLKALRTRLRHLDEVVAARQAEAATLGTDLVAARGFRPLLQRPLDAAVGRFLAATAQLAALQRAGRPAYETNVWTLTVTLRQQVVEPPVVECLGRFAQAWQAARAQQTAGAG